MARMKIAITMEESLVRRIDALVAACEYANRSRAIERAVKEKLDRLGTVRLARECARLDPAEEKGLAEEGDFEEWPEY